MAKYFVNSSAWNEAIAGQWNITFSVWVSGAGGETFCEFSSIINIEMWEEQELEEEYIEPFALPIFSQDCRALALLFTHLSYSARLSKLQYSKSPVRSGRRARVCLWTFQLWASVARRKILSHGKYRALRSSPPLSLFMKDFLSMRRDGADRGFWRNRISYYLKNRI